MKLIYTVGDEKEFSLYSSGSRLRQHCPPCNKRLTGEGQTNLINIYTSYMGFPGGSDGKESACNAGDLGLIPGLGRSSGEGHGNPLQYSCLENPTDTVSGSRILLLAFLTSSPAHEFSNPILKAICVNGDWKWE